MWLRRIDIQGYRSLKDISIDLAPLTILLGPNNSGKSNVLRAMSFLLDPGVKIEDSEAFHPSGSQDSSIHDGTTIYVEGTFTDLGESEERTFLKYVSPSGEVTVRRFATFDGGQWTTGYRGVLWEPSIDWMRSDGIESRQLTLRKNLQSLIDSDNMAAPLGVFLARKGRIPKDDLADEISALRLKHATDLTYKKQLETSNFLGQSNVAGGILPEFLFLPAVRDLNDESATRTTASFGRLLRYAVQAMLSSDSRIQSLSDDLANLLSALNDRSADGDDQSVLQLLENAIQGELGHWVDVGVRIQVDAPSIEQIFNLGSQMLVDDGVETPANQKGHGLQRALVFALMRAWSRHTRESRKTRGSRGRTPTLSLVYGIEEPELSLHPHAQRILARDLRSISEDGLSQVIMTTHSSQFVDMEHYREIGILGIDSPQLGSYIRQTNSDIFDSGYSDAERRGFLLSEWIDAARGELFFSKLVVLVEGPTEKAALPLLADRMGADIAEVSIVDCAGKHNIPAYCRLLNEFRIPYIVVHDEDPVKDGLEGDRLKTARQLYRFNTTITDSVDCSLGSVEQVSPEFEHACGVSRSAADRLGKPFAAVQHLAGLPADDLPKALCAIVTRIEESCSTQ